MLTLVSIIRVSGILGIHCNASCHFVPFSNCRGGGVNFNLFLYYTVSVVVVAHLMKTKLNFKMNNPTTSLVLRSFPCNQL